MTEYRPAPAVAKIAGELIPKWHDHLNRPDVEIRYVFRDKAAKSKGRTVYGTARKVSGLNAFLAEPDPHESYVEGPGFFVIEIAEDCWSELKGDQRQALVDHELCHCWVEPDENDNPVLKIRGHDLEEFRQIVDRHGLWDSMLEDFAASIEKQLTLPISDRPADPPEESA